MRVPIRAVLFDMGGTLEDIYYDDAIRRVATREVHAFLAQAGLASALTVDELFARLQSGMKAYQDWREATEIELPPERVWPEFVFRDYPVDHDKLIAVAEELALMYDRGFYLRRMRPEVPGLLNALDGMGFRLGVISNVYSRGQVPRQLADWGLDRCFQVVITSSGLGLRKPHPGIFLEATRQLGLEPAACAYVGDTISRDVAGARRAGYGMVIQIRSFLTDKADRATDVELPDAVVTDLMQVIPHVAAKARQVDGENASRNLV